MAPPSRSSRATRGREGSTAGVYLVGWTELRADLKALTDDGRWAKELNKVHNTVAREASADARSWAREMGGSQRHFAKAIRGRGGARGARIAVVDGNAFGAFWGAKQRWTGWNKEREGRRPNQPSWVGNSWDVAVSGQGPIAINDALAEGLPRYMQMFAEGIDDVTRRARGG